MHRKWNLLILIALTATLSASAQTKSPLLVTVDLSRPAASKFFDRLHPRVFYASGSWALIELTRAQVDLARRAGHSVTVVDSRPTPDAYRLVTKKRSPVTRADVLDADVLLERDGLMITRGDAPIAGAEVSDGLRSVPLRPLHVPLDVETVVGAPVTLASTDSMIASIVARVNPDTVRWFIQNLQDFQTRYAFASTRDDVAEWIKGQFLRMGYASARRDSFFYRDVWHTNVTATLPGKETSDLVIVFGGHHDSNSGSRFTLAPGADDNASGTAAALEAARVLREAGYAPEISIKFATYAAEEVGLIGSEVDAARERDAGTRIKLMINHDMIANRQGPFEESPVRVYYYSGSEAWRELAKQTTDQFTSLVGLTGGQNSSSSDSYSYWSQGYQAVYFFENEFSPVYHSPADTIGNINIDYCAEVIRASTATLLRAAAIPDAVHRLDVADRGDGISLLASWEPGRDGASVAYRMSFGTASGAYDSSFVVSDTTAVIGNLAAGSLYYVGVTPVDAQGNQGFTVEESGTPLLTPLIPAGFTASPDLAAITLQWSANAELDLLGYNVYRSQNPGEQGSLLTPAPIQATSYVDGTAEKHVYQYYAVRAVDNGLLESPPTAQVRSRLVSLDMGVMLADETFNGTGSKGDPTDEQVDEFYRLVSADFAATPYDIALEGQIGLADMGAFSTVVWYNDDMKRFSDSVMARKDVQQYLQFGGKLLYSGYRPAYSFTGDPETDVPFGPGDFVYDYLGIDSISNRSFTRFSGAIPLEGSYPTLHVDSSKALSSNAYHLLQIERIYAAPGASDIYMYDSKYDTSSMFGRAKGGPVGVELITPTHRSVVLSFPLYYIRQDEAQEFIRHVLEERFGEVTDAGELATGIPAGFELAQNYPNPFNPSTTIGFQVPAEGLVTLAVFDVLGRQVASLVNERKSAGSYRVEFDASGLASGLYMYRLTTGSFRQAKKMLLVR